MIPTRVRFARRAPAGRRLGLGAALVLGLAAAAPSQGPAGSGPEARKADESVGSLERAVAAALSSPPDSGPQGESAAQRIARLGPRTIPILFGVLASGDLPSSPLEGIAEPEPATESELQAALGALALLPRAEVRAHMERTLSGEPSEDDVLAVLRVQGRVATAEDLPLLLAAGERVAAGARSKLGSRLVFAQALDALVGRDPSLVEPLGQLARGQPAALLAVVVQAIGGAPSEAALAALGELLGRDPALEILILSEIERTSARLDAVPGQRTLESVRRCLGRLDPMVLVQAARAAATLGDSTALSPLIQLLSHPEELVRGAAYAALGKLTGQRLDPVSGAWESWLEAEEVWWAGQGQECLGILAQGNPAEQVRALEQLARGRIFRDQLVEPIEECLSSEATTVAELACVVLGRLGSKLALPALRAVSASEDPRLSRAARRALERIRDPAACAGRPRPPPAFPEGS